MKIAIVDHSSSPLDTATLQLIAAALFCQICEAVANWNGAGVYTPVSPPEAIEVKSVNDALGPDENELAIWDNPDVAGAGGYHAADPRGKAYGKVFKNTTDGVLQGRYPLSVVASHEMLELFFDMPASIFSARADGQTLDAFEVGDALQMTDYDDPEGRGVRLANYLLPTAFDAGAPGPYDRQGVLKGQYDTTPGGYRIILRAVTDQTGAAQYRAEAHYGPEHPMAKRDLAGLSEEHRAIIEARRAAHMARGSRASQRGVVEWKPLVPSAVASAPAPASAPVAAPIMAPVMAVAPPAAVLAPVVEASVIPPSSVEADLRAELASLREKLTGAQTDLSVAKRSLDGVQRENAQLRSSLSEAVAAGSQVSASLQIAQDARAKAEEAARNHERRAEAVIETCGDIARVVGYNGPEDGDALIAAVTSLREKVAGAETDAGSLPTDGKNESALIRRKLRDGTELAFHWKGTDVDDVFLVVTASRGGLALRARLQRHDAKFLGRLLHSLFS